jgi:hypothetical protein
MKGGQVDVEKEKRKEEGYAQLLGRVTQTPTVETRR